MKKLGRPTDAPKTKKKKHKKILINGYTLKGEN